MESPTIITPTPSVEWVTVMLSQRAEGENPEVIEASIHHLLRNSVVYIPVSVVHIDDETVVQYLIDGYLFIRRDFPDERFFRLEGSKYVQTIITKPSVVRGTRQLACISQAEINRLQQMVRVQEDQGIDVGDTVTVISGPYKRIKATVVEDLPELDSVQVYIHLRSKESLVTLPRSCLRLDSKAPTPSWVDRGQRLCAWFRAAIPVLLWEGDVRGLNELVEQYIHLHGWLLQAQRFSRVLWATKVPLDTSALARKLSEYITILGWAHKAQRLLSHLRVLQEPLPCERLSAVAHEWALLEKWESQTNSLSTAIAASYTCVPPWAELQVVAEEWDRLEGFVTRARVTVADVKKMTSRNLVIDGNNLVCRCAMAPGLSSLRDSKGRPTGGIVGTLNALAALRKRYPEHLIYFVWDGSSQRRRTIFPGYKQGRGAPKATFEGEWLRETLPFFGVFQAVNNIEEADDVIASLVSGRLAGQQNVVVSTDRDLLQVVSETTQLLVPAMGGTKERVYTPKDVCAEYGVDTPEQMPQVRALSGDTSDCIPGVPGFGLKTARKVLALYKTVDRLLDSNLAGLSQGQYTALRAHAPQVRLNVGLLTLVRDLEYQVIPANLDDAAAVQRLQDVDAKDRSVRVFFPNTA